jgi:CxxC motif-containing protein (DUF1111 family)
MRAPVHSRFLLVPLLGLLGCEPRVEPDPEWEYYADVPGDPIAGLDADTLERFEAGRALMDHAFTPEEGLGPAFNADSCSGCHQFPAVGGSAPRYRDFFLVRAPNAMGVLLDAGTNGESPVRNLYVVGDEGHRAEPAHTTLYVRRSAPPFFGVGLFEFVPDEEILRREDSEDADGDGISGRANHEQGRVGRFGYKSQAASVESFNRGAFINQMGVTSNPLFADFPEQPDPLAALGPSWLESLFGMPHAFAQVSAPGEPTTDDDGAADPEISDADQLAILLYSVYVAPLRPAPRTEETREGARLFRRIGCDDCHLPTLDATIGPLPAYTDLLVHDLGQENADGLAVGFATGTEFRTAPLWGVALHGPWLHDGAAATMEEAIDLHGGEGEASRDAFAALNDADQALVIGFLESLGGFDPDGQLKVVADADLPDLGEPGGPDRALSPEEASLWEQGRALFDRSMPVSEGLGTFFNADSCRACHQDPVLGGAGGIDTSVLRFGRTEADGSFTPLGRNALPRGVVPGEIPFRLPDEANTVELRNPPTSLGVGRIDAIAQSTILANEDPDDLDTDGISGRARLLAGDQVGRFGWKAQVPTVADFAADALLNEVGLTIDPALSPFTAPDDDGVHDPDLDTESFAALVFYLSHLAPPARVDVSAPEVMAGETHFATFGCDACHLPELDGVPLYSDLLLHDPGGGGGTAHRVPHPAAVGPPGHGALPAPRAGEHARRRDPGGPLRGGGGLARGVRGRHPRGTRGAGAVPPVPLDRALSTSR